MILPIVAYGDPVLKKRAAEITADYTDLQSLITNMYETMYGAYGVGLAAPQIGLSVRIFLVDTAPFAEDESYSEAERKVLKSFKKTFINPEILEITGEEWIMNEGCLSLPEIREDVSRPDTVRIKYFDENFVKELKLNMPDMIYVYSQNSALSFLKFIKIYQMDRLWQDTNLMCIGEKTSSLLNEIKWKKIFLFNPGEEEFLLYKI